jgi:hypothetical protein
VLADLGGVLILGVLAGLLLMGVPFMLWDRRRQRQDPPARGFFDDE